MKKIVFTVSKDVWCNKIKANSMLVEESDKIIMCSPRDLFNIMYDLTVKYNERNIAVLFEID